MLRAVGITFKGDRGDRDDRGACKSPFQVVIFRLALSQGETPAIIVDRDGNVIRIVEGRRASIEGRVVELPLRGSELPDELVEVVPVFLVAEAAAFRCEIEDRKST